MALLVTAMPGVHFVIQPYTGLQQQTAATLTAMSPHLDVHVFDTGAPSAALLALPRAATGGLWLVGTLHANTELVPLAFG